MAKAVQVEGICKVFYPEEAGSGEEGAVPCRGRGETEMDVEMRVCDALDYVVPNLSGDEDFHVVRGAKFGSERERGNVGELHREVAVQVQGECRDRGECMRGMENGIDGKNMRGVYERWGKRSEGE